MKFITTYLIPVFLVGCSNFPYMPDVEQGTPINTAEFSKIHTGDSEDTVIASLGQPSFKHIYHNNQWYYMIENNQYKTPLIYKLVFKDHSLVSVNTNQST